MRREENPGKNPVHAENRKDAEKLKGWPMIHPFDGDSEELADGYREMANDDEREREAEAWC